ncbi:haloalkane dehalogenase [Sulfitobacter sabulilitoris]|uniref:Alpha/beta fold hydrolase n=1 Tax=Sulfitobacter sabulilitoris TaxID=2562655 RepID=A0A5S3PHX0_9RHOB|nr:haloalkane dehalogenase [Sulfitobacter sabulilitoris]TMM51535.1 alpha/beta fold hydrolase [Sulfitobacter sabulilitoris]
MDYLRTPDDRFADLPDFDFPPHYLHVDDTQGGRLRLHYVDAGPAEAAPILALHGEPTWSFLYRHMIPVLARAGHRVIAPDLIGFGRSDKPRQRSDYTYGRHVDWIAEAVEQLDLDGITLVCQDWGGLIGLRLVAQMPQRFARIVVANTALPTGDQPMGEAFENWRSYSQTVPEFRAGRIVHGGTARGLGAQAIAAYDAPFPDPAYLAGARQFPMLVPTTPDDPASDANRAAWTVLQGLDLPVLTAFGADDRIMAGLDRVFQARMPGARGQPHVLLPQAGHFLQEDVGPELAERICDFIAATS